MFRYFCVFAILVSAVDAEAQIDKTFTELIDTPKATSSIRSSVQQRQDRASKACKEDSKKLKSELRSVQKQLPGVPADSELRDDLHEQISTLEKSLHSQNRECDQEIPSRSAIELAKARLIDKWPDRREKTKRQGENGTGHERKHGNVEDIGFRNVGGGLEGQAKDLSTGEQAIRQMKGSGMMPAETQDISMQRNVESLARRIATHSDLRIPLKVTVLESNDIDAMGLPGGFLFVTSGLVRACESDDQLAGVLAREIAHIAARHGAKHSKRSLISKILVPAARVATGFLTAGTVSPGAYYGLTYGFQGLESIVDRTLIGTGEAAQKEADQLGIQYAWNAGFDPKGFVEFLDTLAKKQEFSRSESWFQLKPSLDARLMGSFTEIQFLRDRDYHLWHPGQ